MNTKLERSTRETPVILVTGCSSGIGAASARAMRARGWRVFAAARKPADVSALERAGFDALHLDYRDTGSITRAVAEMREASSGRIDALFNNGAIGLTAALEDTPTTALRELFDTNLFGWHELNRSIIALMRAQGHGRIVHCSSVLGLVALKFRGAYVASKFALEGYCDTLRLELSGSGIFVSLIEPGPVDTQFSANARAGFERLIAGPALRSSPFHGYYQRYRAGELPDRAARFRLPPEAVAKKLVHAVEAKRPRPRYGVTLPTHAFSLARRILGTQALDFLLARASSDREAP